MSPVENEDGFYALRAAIRHRWCTRMADEHGRTMSEEFGITVDPIKADEADGSGQYLTKVGYELAMIDTKLGRGEGHRTPFAIMHDAAETGDTADIGLVREWIEASYKKHSISWSRDIREALGLGKAKTDEELAAEDPGGDAVVEIDRALWSLLAKRRDGARAGLLAAFENSSDNRRCVAAAVEYLVDLGYPVGVDEAGPIPVIGLVNHPPQHQQEQPSC